MSQRIGVALATVVTSADYFATVKDYRADRYFASRPCEFSLCEG